MNKNLQNYSQAFVSLLFLSGMALLTFAQGHGPRRPGPPPNQSGFPSQDRRGPGQDHPAPFPGGQSFRFLSAEMRGGKTVKSAPFSATAETSFVQPLLGGGQTTRKSTAKLYRDSEGRTRREQTMSNVGPFATADDAPEVVFINDPVAGVNYVLDARNRTARKMSARPDPTHDGRRPPSDTGRREPPPEGRKPSSESSNGPKTETLGKQIIEGIEAEGTRTTFTIPPEKSGYDQPLEIVSERWYAPALQEVILSKHRDPRYGENIYRLTNINRSEPPAALFQPPADYTISESRGGRGGKPMMRRPDEKDED
ncbi:MAG TPA: hypothetical protein VFZ34_19395 [Blastocatellia bacterium]|nr:hypothetical protein [Blastocatellia bacterium]